MTRRAPTEIWASTSTGSHAAQADREHRRDRGGRGDRFGAAAEQSERDAPEREQPRRRPPVDRVWVRGRSCPVCPHCQLGAGTESTTERTMPSAGVPRAQASSVSTTRCASVGSATWRTSSGVTKSRPLSHRECPAHLEQSEAAARARSEREVARPAGGLDDRDDVVDERRMHMHPFDRVLQREERRTVHHGATPPARRSHARSGGAAVRPRARRPDSRSRCAG